MYEIFTSIIYMDVLIVYELFIYCMDVYLFTSLFKMTKLKLSSVTIITNTQQVETTYCGVLVIVWQQEQIISIEITFLY